MTDSPDERDSEDAATRAPGEGRTPEPEPIEPAAPEAFGLVQAWWGDGKGKTTAAMGMGFRAAGHGYRVHMLVLDEILYAANRELIDPAAVVDLVETKPDGLELVLTGGHDAPDYLREQADLVTNVRKEAHPFDDGHRARKGTEF